MLVIMVLVLKQLCRIASTDVAELGETAVIDKQPTNANTNPCRIPDSTGVTIIGNCLQNETCQSAAAPGHRSPYQFQSIFVATANEEQYVILQKTYTHFQSMLPVIRISDKN